MNLHDCLLKVLCAFSRFNICLWNREV